MLLNLLFWRVLSHLYNTSGVVVHGLQKANLVVTVVGNGKTTTKTLCNEKKCELLCISWLQNICKAAVSASFLLYRWKWINFLTVHPTVLSLFDSFPLLSWNISSLKLFTWLDFVLNLSCYFQNILDLLFFLRGFFPQVAVLNVEVVGYTFYVCEWLWWLVGAVNGVKKLEKIL
jgi:hypothetical protein